MLLCLYLTQRRFLGDLLLQFLNARRRRTSPHDDTEYQDRTVTLMIRISIPKKLLSLPVSRSCDEMGRLHENRSGKKKRFKIVLGALTISVGQRRVPYIRVNCSANQEVTELSLRVGLRTARLMKPTSIRTVSRSECGPSRSWRQTPL